MKKLICFYTSNKLVKPSRMVKLMDGSENQKSSEDEQPAQKVEREGTTIGKAIESRAKAFQTELLDLANDEAKLNEANIAELATKARDDVNAMVSKHPEMAGSAEGKIIESAQKEALANINNYESYYDTRKKEIHYVFSAIEKGNADLAMIDGKIDGGEKIAARIFAIQNPDDKRIKGAMAGLTEMEAQNKENTEILTLVNSTIDELNEKPFKISRQGAEQLTKAADIQLKKAEDYATTVSQAHNLVEGWRNESRANGQKNGELFLQAKAEQDAARKARKETLASRENSAGS